ncbi:hypothetical protein [Nocardia yamanashiensis]|uniref:hypothetical protein n=1 Tax=Nocardia yamanashiensis TaxID=209247 RepID=UPI00083437D2|nr:hypothetical protein [Nocardia yamanashiensis]
MTGTPPSAPRDPSGEPPAERGGRQYPGAPGQHQNPEPAPHSGAGAQGPGHGRHEMPGLAGYPQFEGPGAAQYGSEQVEPPPSMPPHSGAASGGYPVSQQPSGSHPPGAAAPGYGGQGTVPPATVPIGSDQSDIPQQGGYQPGAPGTTPPPAPVQQRPSLDVGHAIYYGWNRFRLNPLPWVGMVLIGLIAWLVVTLLVNLVQVESLSAVLLLFAVASLVVWLLQAAMIRGALYETDGTPPDFPAFFGFVNAGNVLITALIVFVAALIASLLCVFPVVIVGVLCMFALHFVIDQDQDPLTAIKSSAQLVIRNPAQIALLALAVMVITAIGALLCGLGLLVAGPVTAMAITYAYRTLTGGLVAHY